MIARHFKNSVYQKQRTLVVLQQLAKLDSKPQCFTKKIIYNNQTDKKWWQTHAKCHQKNTWFLIEPLGCFSDPKHNILSVYRITARSMGVQLPISIFQVTQAVHTRKKGICKSVRVLLRSGRLSFRQIG